MAIIIVAIIILIVAIICVAIMAWKNKNQVYESYVVYIRIKSSCFELKVVSVQLNTFGADSYRCQV